MYPQYPQKYPLPASSYEASQSGKQNLSRVQSRDQNQNKNSKKGADLLLLILILGILSILSLGILTLSFIRQLYPQGFAAINKELNYQGKLQDQDGITVADGTYNIEFSIYTVASGGTPVWTECGTVGTPTERGVSVSSGVFSVLLGDTASGACPGGTNSNAISLDFTATDYFLGVTISGDSEMTPRKRIGAALYAFNADLLDGFDETAFGRLAQDETVTGSWIFGDANTDTVVFTAYINSDLYVGANAETIDNTGFDMDGIGSGFFTDMLGVKGNIYTDGAFITGASTTYADGSITTTGTTDLTINPAGGDVIITDDNFLIDTTTFYVDAVTNDNIGIGTATPVADRTVDLTTSKKYGLYSETSSIDKSASGVYGATSSSANQNYGGYFISAGTTGSAAVYGYATDTTGATRGGFFQADGIDATGVYAQVTNASTTYGVYGTSLGSGAVSNYGGYFTSAGDTGFGVYGEAVATTGGPNYGGYFKAGGTGASAGVYGKATYAGAVANYGGYFEAAGNSGYGVKGVASATGNVYNAGGSFQAAGDLSYGVMGSATATSATSNYGGYFQAAGTGGARGVHGFASGGSGTNYGVYGVSQSSSGWGGYFTGGYGLYGSKLVGGSATDPTTYELYITGEGYLSSDLSVIGHLGVGVTASDTRNLYSYETFTGVPLTADEYYRGIESYVSSDIDNSTYTLYLYGVESASYYTGTSTTGSIYSYGVYASSNNTSTGTVTGSYGVYGISGKTGGGIVTNGYGGYFKSTNATTNYGVYATVAGASDWAGYFTGGYGLYGDRLVLQDASGDATKVINSSETYIGTLDSGNESRYGIYNQVQSSIDNTAAEKLTLYGTYSEGAYTGTDTDAADYFYGVYGSSQNTSTGTLANSYGIYGESTNEGAGTISTSYGVYGYSKENAGTIGVGYGGYFKSEDAGSNYGVYGFGADYGVYGITNVATGYSGYFTGGTYGLYASRIQTGRLPTGDDTANQVVIQGALCVDDSTQSCDASPTDGTIYAESATITEIDLAENFESSQKLEAGDVVSIDPHSSEKVIKSTKSYDNTVIGIVSTKPGLLLGGVSDPNNYPVALAGRVPIKVSAENGPIKIGDKLTTSSTPGVAMKAVKTGPIIGMALEAYNNEKSGKIVAFVSIDWSGGVTTTTEVAQKEIRIVEKVALDKLISDLDANNFSITNIKKIVSADEVWSIDEDGVLRVKIPIETPPNPLLGKAEPPLNPLLGKAEPPLNPLLGKEGKGVVEIYGLSSTEIEVVLSGSSNLEEGQALIDFALIDEDFAEIIDQEIPLKIVVTPTAPCEGLYVEEKYPQGFKVKELNDGVSDATFDWIVIGRRKGY